MDRHLPRILKEDPDAELYIKEKYGLLRVDLYSKKIPIDRHMALENAAEMEASVVCECCGRPGKHRPKLDWMLTLCDRCYKKGRKFRDKITDETEKRWLADESLEEPLENYEKRSAPQRRDLAEYGIDFEIDDDLHRLIDGMLEQPASEVPGFYIARGIAERLADGLLTGDQACALYRKFVRDASEWV